MDQTKPTGERRQLAKDRLSGSAIVFATAMLVSLLPLATTLNAQSSFSPIEITAAFARCHNGYSSDELLIRDELRNCFLERLAVNGASPLNGDAERDALLALLKLRKSGKLSVPATRRGVPVAPEIYPVAEIAARVVTDRHRVPIDRLLADPRLRDELAREAEKISAGTEPYQLRKAVLGLRKKRALRPELVLQVARWKRQIETHSLESLGLMLQQDKVHSGPGIYLFRARSGYLYIGEAGNLAERLAEHLRGDGQTALANYLAGDEHAKVTVELHVFDAESPAKNVRMRRAYESDLIRSRRPEFNIRP